MRGVFALLLLGAFGFAAHAQQPQENRTQEDRTQGDRQPASDSAEGPRKQLYEVRRYVLGDRNDAEALDRYLSEVLLPALERSGAGPVGAFAPAENAETQDRFLIVTYDRIGQIPQVRRKLMRDPQFAEATEKFEAGGPDNPPYERIHSELLLAMDAMPEAKTVGSEEAPESRVYELRIYESANEGLGNRKVEMFNQGEVPIFLDSGINPVFLGQSMLGPHTPSLTYLTAYADEAARQQAWKTFIAHPEWKKLSGEKRYAGTVSKIFKFVLRPLQNSQM